jgi:hypothetical protein
MVNKKPPQLALRRFGKPSSVEDYSAAAAAALEAGVALAVSFSLIRADLPLRSRK